ncbi:MAG: hypothetical protein IH944_11120 [Armatimonadetes bacterium]|nr:hypothetical protein [Armatimonadota bacterium]
MHWTPFTDLRFLAAYGYTLIVLGAIGALALPLLNLIAPEQIVPGLVSISLAGGFVVLVGVTLLWMALGRQPKSASLRRARAFLFSYLLRLTNISHDKKSKAIVKWIRVAWVLLAVATLAAFTQRANDERALVSVTIILGIGLLLIWILWLNVWLLVRQARMERRKLDD